MLEEHSALAVDPRERVNAVRTKIALLCLFAAIVMFLPIVVRAAGDASAIRRATRTEDVGWVSNYRPKSTSASHRYSYRGGGRAVRTVNCHGRK
jgi:hypothetical protein